jgi:hypothetical protein
MTMSKEQMLEDNRLQIRAAADDLVHIFSLDVAIKVLTEELGSVKRRKEEGHAPSEEFMRALTHTGSMVILCEHCHRTHFATSSDNWYEEGELEDLREKARRDPAKYVERGDCDSISWGTIEGKQTVWGCPCNTAGVYEVWIWNHRFLITDYLTARCNEDLRSARRSAENASRAAAAVHASSDLAEG